jgi:hypothetical protein
MVIAAFTQINLHCSSSVERNPRETHRAILLLLSVAFDFLSERRFEQPNPFIKHEPRVIPLPSALNASRLEYLVWNIETKVKHALWRASPCPTVRQKSVHFLPRKKQCAVSIPASTYTARPKKVWRIHAGEKEKVSILREREIVKPHREPENAPIATPLPCYRRFFRNPRSRSLHLERRDTAARTRAASEWPNQCPALAGTSE